MTKTTIKEQKAIVKPIVLRLPISSFVGRHGYISLANNSFANRPRAPELDTGDAELVFAWYTEKSSYSRNDSKLCEELSELFTQRMAACRQLPVKLLKKLDLLPRQFLRHLHKDLDKLIAPRNARK